MNQQQLEGIARPIIAAIAVLLGANHVLFDNDTWNIVLTSVVVAAMAIWSYKRHTTSSMVRAVDELAKDRNSEVKAVITEDTVAGAALANSIPGTTTVVAGSVAARSASESGSPAVRWP